MNWRVSGRAVGGVLSRYMLRLLTRLWSWWCFPMAWATEAVTTEAKATPTMARKPRTAFEKPAMRCAQKPMSMKMEGMNAKST